MWAWVINHMIILQENIGSHCKYLDALCLTTESLNYTQCLLVHVYMCPCMYMYMCIRPVVTGSVEVDGVTINFNF